MTDDEARPTPPLPGFIPALLDDAACVTDDLACVSCGYNLRTLSTEGACPECGRDVLLSVKMARDIPLKCLRHARAGAEQLAMAGWAGIVASVLGMVLVAINQSATIHAYIINGTMIVTVLAMVTFYAACGFGFVNFTVRDSVAHGGLTARRVARWCPLVAILAGLASGNVMPTGASGVLPAIIRGVLGAFLPVTWCALLVHASKLMGRVSRPNIASFAMRQCWAVAVGSGVVMTSMILAEFNASLTMPAHLLSLLVLAGLLAANAVLFRRVMRALATAQEHVEQYMREFKVGISDMTKPAAKWGVGGTP